jgi:peptidoglycan/LPS O-acetylase OafA/YrhL
MAANPQDFRSDINGLRAWAVVAVALYHFGVPGFGGGFVGVDVFFVISGFLMTGIVLRGLERGDFSLIGFYLARARRIVPALAGLCATLLLLGWFVLLPPDYQILSTHAIYSLAFLSNVEYWQEAGYFDQASHEKWLLHTWSLSVEWQFYLLLPVLLAVLWRLAPGRAALRRALCAGAVLSLTYSVWASDSQPSAAFYLLPSRAWELLAGGLVCLLPPLRWTPARRRWLEGGGLLLIVLAIATFSSQQSWPGWRAAAPVCGAMLVLAARRDSAWTGSRAAQWLGERSYSLYLWHWPIYVVLVYVELRGAPLALAAGLLATLALGHLSYRWLESTGRRLLAPPVRRAGPALLLMLAVVTLPGLAVWRLHGVAGRFPARVELAAAEAGNLNPRRAACHATTGGDSRSCVYGGADWKVIAVGDSHVEAIVSAIASAAPDRAHAGVVQWSYSSCPFVAGLKTVPASVLNRAGDYDCSQFISWAGTRLAALPPEVPVIIIGRYAAAALGPNEEHQGMAAPTVYFSRIAARPTPLFLDEFASHVTDSACALARQRTVYMVRPIPEMGVDVPKTLSRRMSFGMPGEISVPLADYRRRNAWLWAAQDAAHERCGVRILDPLPYLCHEGRCFGSLDGRPLYHDDNHLSEYGNKLLAPMFEPVFRGLPGKTVSHAQL